MARRTRSASQLLLCASLFALGACKDEPPTAPRAIPLRSSASLLAGGDPPPPPGTFSTTLSPTGSDQDVGPVTFGTLAANTWVEVRASGLLDQYYSTARTWPDSLKGQLKGQWDAGGHFDWNTYCQGNVSVWGTVGGSIVFCRWGSYIPVTDVWVDTVIMNGNVTAKWAKGPPTWSAYCDDPGNPCYTYTGSHAITVTPISQYLQLTATPSTIMSGDTVTFTASAPGKSFTVQEWIWQPDEPPISFAGTGSSGAQMTTSESTCGAGDVTCVRPILESGTMYVRASVGGYNEQAKAHVSVQPDLVRLQANRTSVKPGEEVKFTASTENGTSFTVQSWKWEGSSPPAIGQALTSAAGCGTQDECTIKVYETGTMTVTAVVSGASEPQDASASVSVIPCDSTGDPLLDSPEARKGLVDAMDASNPDSLPGTGARHEVPGIFYQRLDDGSYFFFPYPDPNATECHADLGPQPVPDGTTEAGTGHTHPSGTGDDVYGCGPIGGVQQAQRPGDGKPVPKAKPFGNGGGSDADWDMTAQGFPVYTLNKEGGLARLDPNTAPVDRKNNPNRWTRDGDSICFTR